MRDFTTVEFINTKLKLLAAGDIESDEKGNRITERGIIAIEKFMSFLPNDLVMLLTLYFQRKFAEILKDRWKYD